MGTPWTLLPPSMATPLFTSPQNRGVLTECDSSSAWAQTGTWRTRLGERRCTLRAASGKRRWRALVREFQLDPNAGRRGTPMHDAIMNGQTGTVLALINDLRVAPDAAMLVPFALSPLMTAAAREETGAMLALINIGGALIDASDAEGHTALHLACIYGCPVAVAALLAEGARLDVKSIDGVTPQQSICTHKDADPAAKPLVAAAFVRHLRLQSLGPRCCGWPPRGTTTA
jgi:hypothetical protein